MGEELLGTEEITMALQNYEVELNIKESNFPNVILLDLSLTPLEALKILENSPTTVISKIVPIESVVRTRLDSILEKVTNLAGEKVTSGESFNVICDLRGRKYIESKDDLLNRISKELIEKYSLTPENTNPDWIVQIEVVGENTGISILKPFQILKI